MAVQGDLPFSGRDRSSSFAASSAQTHDHEHHKRSHVLARVTGASLRPSDGHSGKKSKRSRRGSGSSKSGIAAALAKTGLHLPATHGTHGLDDQASVKTAASTDARTSGRSPFLVRNKDDDAGSSMLGAEGDDEASMIQAYADDDDDEDDESDTSSEGNDIPVSGFAVASNRRNSEFHAQFPTVDEGDYLIEGKCELDAAEYRLWLCLGQGDTRSRPLLRVGESYLLSR
jgi:hypothetical protein